jgi:hypothetical protein
MKIMNHQKNTTKKPLNQNKMTEINIDNTDYYLWCIENNVIPYLSKFKTE